ncbi:MAG: hypothetical protein LBR91_01750 [Puniceicoccales bacterium]|jgi:hypothetical protein|nr:hypothetical protein [Puniceicoccales bacterium]
MKKSSVILVFLIGVLTFRVASMGATGGDFELVVGTKFATERVAHGCKICGRVIVPSVTVGYKASDELKVFLSTDVIAALEQKYGRVSPCIGFTYEATDMLTLEAGYTRYFYLSGDKQKHSNEIYGGVTANVLLSPAVYSFYDFNNEDFSIETKVSHKFDLGDIVAPGVGVRIGAKVGYERARKCSGECIADHEKRDFFYYGATADIVYDINSNATARVGVAYEGNSANKNSWVNSGTTKNFTWMNASIDCSF